MGILFAIVAGAFCFWGCFISVYETLKSKKKDLVLARPPSPTFRTTGKASKPRRTESYRRVGLEFWNTNPVLLRDFANHVKRVYDYQPWIDFKRGRVEIRRVAVVNDLLKYGPYDSHNWAIPSEITNGDLNVRREWIRCFGDGEGHVSKSKKEITFKSVNLSGLEKFKQLLYGLGIPSRMNGPYDGAYVLTISKSSELRKYHEIISFVIPEKEKDWQC